MHILHGTWLLENRVFALWGEDTARELAYRKGRRGKRAPHPFALSVSDWLKYLDEYTTDSKPGGQTVTVWLPGVDKDPQPSPSALAAGVPAPEGEVEFLAWEIEAVTLRPTDTLDLMLQLPYEPRGFALGRDLLFWQQAALLVMNSLAEGRYIPTIEQQGNQYIARWQARPSPNLVRQLAANMPRLCRAAVNNHQDALSPMALLDDFLQTMTDAFVREQYNAYVPSGQPWMRALTGTTNRLMEQAKPAARLYREWQRWQEVGEKDGGPFRVGFRLREPAVADGPWSLDYLLQATDDHSLVIDAETIWSAKADQLDYLQYRFQRPQERLLAALGLASRIFPPIERSLRTTRPNGVELDRDEAYRFLVEAGPMLESSGFAVLVPNWWGRQARLRARVSMRGQDQSDQVARYLNTENLVRYQWQLSLGGQPISRDEFEQLVALKQPIVQFKGEWVTLNPEQIESALKFFEQSEQAPEGEMGLLDALKMSADLEDAEIEGMEIENTVVEGWLNDLFERLRQPEQAAVPQIPNSLKANLRPYQERGFGWLAQMQQLGLGACLADDMGLGKTLQTITVWLYEREQLGIKRPSLLVCPTSVVGNWQHELSRFAPSLKVYKHQGPTRHKDGNFASAAKKADVVLTSYSLLSRDLDFLDELDWANVVLDEAQNIKNPSTKQAQAARKLRGDYKLALTGTPVENRLSELWSIFHFLNPGYLGSRQSFRSQFAIPIERYGDEHATGALRKLTAPFILRRLKTDPTIIQDLPEKFENKVYCTLTAEQATLYEAVVREEMEQIEQADEDMARRGSILRMLTRLKQVCNHPAHFLGEGEGAELDDRSGKLERLVEMLEEVRDVDERALIFTQYAQMGDLLQPYLREVLVDEVLFLHGGTPTKKREEMIRLFQSPNGPPIFILSLKAGGTGLNLTNANHVFHFDRWYNPAVENQATDRAFRIGQTKTVQVHKFIALGTLEEHIDEMIEHKKALADQVVGTGEAWLSELDNTQLRELVTLRHEALEGV
jgi:SNF2 family DNA or RNA helicase